eukprot:12005941-Alexandrium_andersonii.AAC.1
MSASLVGSEMCIRDRSGRPPAGAVPADATSAPLPPTLTVGGRRLSPVSYTHLTLPTICSV